MGLVCRRGRWKAHSSRSRYARDSERLREIGLAPDSNFEFGTLVDHFEEIVRSGFIQTSVINSVPDRLATAAAAGPPCFACRSSRQLPGVRKRPASAHVSAVRAVRRR